MGIKTVKVVIDGQTHVLTYDETSQQYKATISAPLETSYGQNEGHYYPITLTAIDDAGNSITVDDSDETFGEKLQLQVKEVTKPSIEVTSPTTGSIINNATPTITWNVTDLESGINSETISFKLNGVLIGSDSISKTEIEHGYKCKYISTELVNGTQTCVFNVSDNDGNRADELTTNFIVDTTGPSLTVEEPSSDITTNKNKIVITGKVDDISKPITLTINDSPVVIGTGGEFAHEYELIEGTNIVTVIARDSLNNETRIIRNITLDTKPPVISEVTLKPNPVNVGQTYIITVTVVDP